MPATRERFLRIIAREARRMQALVEDLMSLSRIEAVKHDAPRDRSIWSLWRAMWQAKSETALTEVMIDRPMPRRRDRRRR